ncbi:MAG TPA: energy transducer TonB [Terriglobales bacterium]|nr:energy transducer TonB [Terriglobales bacterium]
MFSGMEFAQGQPLRRWAALFSFALQATVVAAILVFPLLYPRSLPEAFARRRIFVPASGNPAPVRAAERSHAGRIAPTIPTVVRQGPSIRPVSPIAGSDTGAQLPLGLADLGNGAGVPHSILSDFTRLVVPPPPPRVARPSVMMQGSLIHRVEPRYPAIAVQTRTEGSVIIKAVISREGRIEQAEVMSGPALLAMAAMDAVRQWRYRPYVLNGEPVEVETEITVNFTLRR